MVLTAELLLGICLKQTMKVKFLFLLKLYILYTILCTILPLNLSIPKYLFKQPLQKTKQSSN